MWAGQKGLLFWVPNHNNHSEDPAHLHISLVGGTDCSISRGC